MTDASFHSYIKNIYLSAALCIGHDATGAAGIWSWRYKDLVGLFCPLFCGLKHYALSSGTFLGLFPPRLPTAVIVQETHCSFQAVVVLLISPGLHAWDVAFAECIIT